MSDPSRVRFTGPLKKYAAGFAGELARQGYTADSASQQMQLMAHLSRWIKRKRIDADTLDPRQVVQFLRSRRNAGFTSRLTEKSMRPMLTYLRGLGAVPLAPATVPEGPVEERLEMYHHHLTVERGLGSRTARVYVDSVRHFLKGRISRDGLSLQLSLTAADVMQFVVARCAAQTRSPAKLTVAALRSFLRYLHVEGVITRALADVVPSVAGWRLASLPKALESEQVCRLLVSCDRRTQTGRRDFAILTVLARFGLRAGEVSKLSLDDIDWRSGTMVVRGKGNRVERLPLPADVGKAVADYLRRGRPDIAEGRTVFVRVKAPHGSLSPSGVTQVVAAAAKRAGLGSMYAHRLRHTAATRMLQAGATLPEIGQVLRHRRASTTAIYAKVHSRALRSISRRWPGSAT